MTSPKRTFPAEWAPQAAVQLTFPPAAADWPDEREDLLRPFVDIAEAVARFQPVVVVCENLRETKKLLAHLPAERLFLAEVPSNDSWARDHGGITIFENGRPVVLDFMFNGWGLKFHAFLDNLITAALFRRGTYNKVYKNAPRRPVRRVGGMVLEGGSLETDGLGTLLTTEDCLLSPNRNPHLSKKQVEARLKKLLGLSRILWLKHGALEGDDTDSHIDTLARFCDPQTIVYQACDDPADSHFADLKKMEEELQQLRQADGKPYRLVALPWPTPCFSKTDGHRLPASYANFLIINGAVLVPTYRVPEDAAALKVLGGCFPGREIVGVDCRPIVEWHGSLHCLTMQWPAAVE